MTVAGQTLVDYDWFRNDLLKTITQGTAARSAWSLQGLLVRSSASLAGACCSEAP
jgi:hypothetical protein